LTSETKPKISKNVLLLSIAGLIAFLLYLFYFVGVSNFVSSIERVNFFYYSLAFVFVVVTVFCYSMVWHGLLCNLSCKLKIKTAFFFTWIGIFVDSFVPSGLSGDLFKSYWLSRTSGYSTGQIASTVIGQKILIIAVTLGSLLSGLLLWALGYGVIDTVVVSAIIGIAFILVFTLFLLFYLSGKPTATSTLLRFIIRLICFVRGNRWNPSDFQAKAEKSLDSFHKGIETLKMNRRALAKPVVFSLLAWASDLAVFFLCFTAIGYNLFADRALIAYALTATLAIEGFSFIGFNEIIRSSIFIALGIPPAISATSTLLNRFATFWFKLIVSYAVFQWKVLMTHDSQVKTKKISPENGIVP
jgi:uncharacterized protein (TIRG00374 family)